MGKLKARELAEGRQRTGEQQRLGPDLQALFSCIYEHSFPESQSPQPKCFGEWLVWICEASWEFAYKEDPSVSKRITFFFDLPYFLQTLVMIRCFFFFFFKLLLQNEHLQTWRLKITTAIYCLTTLHGLDSAGYFFGSIWRQPGQGSSGGLSRQECPGLLAFTWLRVGLTVAWELNWGSGMECSSSFQTVSMSGVSFSRCNSWVPRGSVPSVCKQRLVIWMSSFWSYVASLLPHSIGQSKSQDSLIQEEGKSTSLFHGQKDNESAAIFNLSVLLEKQQTQW